MGRWSWSCQTIPCSTSRLGRRATLPTSRPASASGLAELHVHLEGTVRHATAIELAQRHGLAPPPPYVYSDLGGFLDIYRQVCACMRTAADFERVIVEHATSMAAQRIEYAELSFNPGLHPGEEWLDGVTNGRRNARELGVEVAWLVELSRGESNARNQRSLEIALATEGVVGIGLVGDESLPANAIVPIVERAHAAGLRFMPHAGQATGPEVVREAVEVFHADRIAHGVAALGDTSVIELLVDRGICLCVCPSSNARIGLRPDYRRLADAGIQLTVNSDDPAMVGTTLAKELELAETVHGLPRDLLIAAAWEFSFSG